MARNGEDRPVIFGWCSDGHHADCMKSYVTLSEPTRVRRCECPCDNHGANRGQT